MNSLLQKAYVAEAAIAAARIVKFGAADGQVVQAAAVGDKLIGVSNELAAAIGERCDIVRVGIADVQLGGAVARGDPITSDANGKGVAAAPAAGINNSIIGFAETSGVLDDVIPVLLAPGRIQG